MLSKAEERKKERSESEGAREREIEGERKREREREAPDSQPWIKPNPIIGAFSITHWCRMIFQGCIPHPNLRQTIANILQTNFKVFIAKMSLKCII